MFIKADVKTVKEHTKETPGSKLKTETFFSKKLHKKLNGRTLKVEEN